MLEEQIKRHKEISQQIEQLEEQKRTLGLAIMEQMSCNSLQIPGYRVKLCKRISIKLSIEEARSLNAVKLEETIDKEKIKILFSNGQGIHGVSEIQYIQITETS